MVARPGRRVGRCLYKVVTVIGFLAPNPRALGFGMGGAIFVCTLRVGFGFGTPLMHSYVVNVK